MLRRLLSLLVILALLAGAYLAIDHLAPEPMATGTLKLQRALAGMQPQRVRIPGYDIAYLDSAPRGGSTSPGEPLVMVHGIGADKDNFTMVSGLLRGVGRRIAPDLPGFGDSSKPEDGDYDIPAQVEHLRAFLDALQLEHVHLAGSSMGGMTVASFAARYPERVASLWLLAPAGIEAAPLARVRAEYAANGSLLLFAQQPEDFERVLDTVFVKRPPLPFSVRQKLARRAARDYDLHTRIFARINERHADWALDPQVAGLATPTLIVWGDRDEVLHVEGGRILQGLMPRAELIVLPDVGHLPMLEQPLRSARDYRAFRERLAQSPG